MNIIAINLRSRTDRRRDLERELDGVGIDPQSVMWYPGIDPRSAAGFRSPGYRGCCLSHLGALSHALASGWEAAFVLEDDCAFDAGFPAVLKSALDNPAWGICFLGHAEQVTPADDGPFVAWPPDRRVWQAHCYMVRREVLAPLCAYMGETLVRSPGDPAGGPMSPDGVLTHFRRDNPQILTLLGAPPVAVQRSSRSDLAPRPWDRVPGLATVADLARRWLKTRHFTAR